MDCLEAHKKIVEGDTADEGLRQHVERCPACAELLAGDGELVRWLSDGTADESMAPPAELLAGVRQELNREQRPFSRLRSLSTPLRVLLSLAAAGLIVGVGLLSVRPDLGVYPLPRLALELGLLVLLGGGAGWLWLRPLHRPPLPGWLVPVMLLSAVLLPWVISSLPAAHLDHPASLAGVGDDLIGRAVACFVFGSLLGLPLVSLVAMLGRGSRGLARVALLPVAAGGLVGLIGLHVHCPLTSPIHLLVGHAPIVLALVLLAAVFRRLPR